MTDAGTITVVLVDDHPVVRAGYRRLLHSTPDIRVAAEAASGEEAYTRYFQLLPSVLILDLSLPGIGGLEILRRIHAKAPEARILVFSMQDSPLMVTRTLEAGATGYLTKVSAAAEMIEAVREVARGNFFLSHNLVPELVRTRLQDADPLQSLTSREFQVFLRLARGDSVTDIARVFCLSTKTVGIHHTHILKKLKLRNIAELTRLAIRSGVLQP